MSLIDEHTPILVHAPYNLASRLAAVLPSLRAVKARARLVDQIASEICHLECLSGVHGRSPRESKVECQVNHHSSRLSPTDYYLQATGKWVQASLTQVSSQYPPRSTRVSADSHLLPSRCSLQFQHSLRSRSHAIFANRSVRRYRFCTFPSASVS